MTASKMLMASMTHFRPLTCAANSASYPSRLVPHPPDLIKWVQREGGFVHQAVKVAQDTTNGLGLVASEEIPKGSDLIALPHHIPLRFATFEYDGGDGLPSALVNLASQVPGTCFHYTLVAIFDSWAYFFIFTGTVCFLRYSWSMGIVQISIVVLNLYVKFGCLFL